MIRITEYVSYGYGEPIFSKSSSEEDKIAFSIFQNLYRNYYKNKFDFCGYNVSFYENSNIYMVSKFDYIWRMAITLDEEFFFIKRAHHRNFYRRNFYNVSQIIRYSSFDFLYGLYTLTTLVSND